MPYMTRRLTPFGRSHRSKRSRRYTAMSGCGSRLRCGCNYSRCESRESSACQELLTDPFGSAKLPHRARDGMLFARPNADPELQSKDQRTKLRDARISRSAKKTLDVINKRLTLGFSAPTHVLCRPAISSLAWISRLSYFSKPLSSNSDIRRSGVRVMGRWPSDHVAFIVFV
jgi:hypothetical protein